MSELELFFSIRQKEGNYVGFLSVLWSGVQWNQALIKRLGSHSVGQMDPRVPGKKWWGNWSETGSSPAGKQMVAVHFVGACDGLRFLSLIIAHKFYYLINSKSHYSKRA